ncbi:MAG: DUF2971 domain-containing protein [Acidobacteriia bacterium]|nr:DUF2971 domain-containing protein [Terriglobia bacterium]
MREKHPAIDAEVDPATPIWRYFDLPKFVSFLGNGALWFSRADLLGDPLEGSVTRAREAERQRFLANPPEGRSREELKAIFLQNAAMYAQNVKCAYVNCWHMGDHESMAMWQGYGGGPYGVAIRSTFGGLSDLLPVSFGDVPMGTIFVARVRYIDYLSETEQISEQYNAFSPFVWKSIAYQHESEVRALFMDMSGYYQQNSPTGHFINVDIQKLTDRVTVSPLAPPWFDGILASICSKFGLQAEIRRSIVYSDPIY